MTNELLTARFNENDEDQMIDEAHMYDNIIEERNHKLTSTILRFVEKDQEFFENRYDKASKKPYCKISCLSLCRKEKVEQEQLEFSEMNEA